MGTQGGRTLSTQGPDFDKAARVPYDVETEELPDARRRWGFGSEDAGSEYSELEVRDLFFCRHYTCTILLPRL